MSEVSATNSQWKNTQRKCVEIFCRSISLEMSSVKSSLDYNQFQNCYSLTIKRKKDIDKVFYIKPDLMSILLTSKDCNEFSEFMIQEGRELAQRRNASRIVESVGTISSWVKKKEDLDLLFETHSSRRYDIALSLLQKQKY